MAKIKKRTKQDNNYVNEKIRQELEDLKSRSKPLYELVATENFTVNEVVGESYRTSFTPTSEMIIGGRSREYQGGYTSNLVLKVTPDNKKIPVRTLNFDGFSAVRAGDYISAQIPRYEEKRALVGLSYSDRDQMFYLDRDFKPEESAIELILLSKRRKVLRTDRAVNYKKFVKE